MKAPSCHHWRLSPHPAGRTKAAPPRQTRSSPHATDRPSWLRPVLPAGYLGRLVAGRRLRLGSRTSPMLRVRVWQVAAALTAFAPGL